MGASGRGSNPNSMNVTPEQRQMLDEWNLARAEMDGSLYPI
jgi:hypothetical protein